MWLMLEVMHTWAMAFQEPNFAIGNENVVTLILKSEQERKKFLSPGTFTSMEASGPDVQLNRCPRTGGAPAAMKSSRASPSLAGEPLSGGVRGVALRTGQGNSSTPWAGLPCLFQGRIPRV